MLLQIFGADIKKQTYVRYRVISFNASVGVGANRASAFVGSGSAQRCRWVFSACLTSAEQALKTQRQRWHDRHSIPRAGSHDQLRVGARALAASKIHPKGR